MAYADDLAEMKRLAAIKRFAADPQGSTPAPVFGQPNPNQDEASYAQERLAKGAAMSGDVPLPPLPPQQYMPIVNAPAGPPSDLAAQPYDPSQVSMGGMPDP